MPSAEDRYRAKRILAAAADLREAGNIVFADMLTEEAKQILESQGEAPDPRQAVEQPQQQQQQQEQPKDDKGE